MSKADYVTFKVAVGDQVTIKLPIKVAALLLAWDVERFQDNDNYNEETDTFSEWELEQVATEDPIATIETLVIDWIESEAGYTDDELRDRITAALGKVAS